MVVSRRLAGYGAVYCRQAHICTPTCDGTSILHKVHRCMQAWYMTSMVQWDLAPKTSLVAGWMAVGHTGQPRDGDQPSRIHHDQLSWAIRNAPRIYRVGITRCTSPIQTPSHIMWQHFYSSVGVQATILKICRGGFLITIPRHTNEPGSMLQNNTALYHRRG